MRLVGEDNMKLSHLQVIAGVIVISTLLVAVYNLFNGVGIFDKFPQTYSYGFVVGQLAGLSIGAVMMYGAIHQKIIEVG